VKYLPLIWSALWRKPGEAVLTWLAVTAAFALLGLMLGVNATLQAQIDNRPADILFVWARFPGVHLVSGMRQQMLRVDGVAGVAVLYGLGGYHIDPRSPVNVVTADEGGRQALPEFRLKPDQWRRLFATRDGIYVSRQSAQRWNLKAGDTFVVTTAPGMRADGGLAWPFQVIDVVPDVPDSQGFILGNYHYIDESRPLPDQGRDVSFQVRVSDPARAHEVSRRIYHLFESSATPVSCLSQRQAYQNMDNSGGHRELTTLAVGAAGLFMILLLIANGIAQSVRQRTGELAVLRTVGFRNGEIMALIFCEAAIPCLAGAVLGTLLAMELARWPAGLLPESFGSLPAPAVSLRVMLYAVGLGALLACATAAVPLLRIGRMRVALQLLEVAR
jgi:putative ABC transport system permease protein